MDTPLDPILLLSSLDSAAILRELEELMRRERALCVLLRAARVQERRSARGRAREAGRAKEERRG
jgi:hypothetical protein